MTTSYHTEPKRVELFTQLSKPFECSFGFSNIHQSINAKIQMVCLSNLFSLAGMIQNVRQSFVEPVYFGESKLKQLCPNLKA